jgi:23S rRNA pseudouridine2605 synthase
MHPSFEVKREYMVRIHGEVDQAMISRLKEGVILEDGVSSFETVRAQHPKIFGDHEQLSRNNWFRVVLAEGKTREVRRLWESQGVEVSRLKRISYGPIQLPSFVRSSEFIELDPKQVTSLFHAVSLRSPKFTERNMLKDIRERKERKLRARGNSYR